MKTTTKVIIGLFVFMLIMSILTYDTYSAEAEQRYSRLKLNPLYRQSILANTNYTYTVDISPPDGFSDIESAIITYQLWMNPTVNYYIWVDGQECNTVSYQIHTTYANAGEGTIYFDCSNIISEAGTYTITLRSDSNGGAITAWADVTYINKPKASMTVHGTEYLPGQNAKLWLQLLNESGDDLENAVCFIDIYSPSNEVYIEDATMSNLEHDGIYYYDLIVPQARGVYPAIAKCFYDVSQTFEYADAFNLFTGTVNDKTYVETWALDGDEHKLDEALLNGQYRLNYTYDINNMCGLNVSEDLLTGISVRVNLKWKDRVINDDIVMYIYNYTGINWITLPNKIVTPNDRVTVTNTIDSNNLTRDGLVSPNGTLKLRFTDTQIADTTKNRVENDWIRIACNQFANPEWTEVKGSSEMHITSNEFWVTTINGGNITNETLEGYFYLDFTINSQSSQLQENELVYLDMYAPFPCHHIRNLTIDGVEKEWYGSNGENSLSGCRVNWLMDLNKGTNYEGIIKTDKWFSQVENDWIVQAQLDYESIKLACDNYRIINGLPAYAVPIDYDPKRGNDTFYDACSQYFDSYHHFNNSYYNEFETITAILTEQDMLGLDNFWYHIKDNADRLRKQSDNILITLASGGSYSTAILANPTGQYVPNFANYFAGISATYGIYGRTLLIDDEVWNYTTRELTNFSFDVSNETAIGEAVWNWNGFVSSNLLSYFNRTVDIWSYVTRTLTGFGFDVVNEQEISDTVWNNSNRTLSTFEFDVTDEDDIWNYVNRTLSTFDFDVSDEALIGLYVWNTSDRQLTNLNFDTTDETEVWNYFNRTVTEFNFFIPINAPLVAQYVWNNSDRQLTELNFDTTNETQVWEYVDRQLTAFNFDVVDEILIGTFVWNNTIRNLTYYPIINYTEQADYVWNNTGRYTHGVILS